VAISDIAAVFHEPMRESGRLLPAECPRRDCLGLSFTREPVIYLAGTQVVLSLSYL
jgi:hypothetical protein